MWVDGAVDSQLDAREKRPPIFVAVVLVVVALVKVGESLALRCYKFWTISVITTVDDICDNGVDLLGALRKDGCL